MVEDSKKFGDERRTLIKTAERAQVERTVVEEPVTVILSRKGWIRARTGHGLDVSQLSFKDGDALLQTLECKTTDPVTVLAASGKTFTVAAADIPGGATAHVNTLVNSGSDDIVWMGSGSPEQRLLMNSSAGLGFPLQAQRSRDQDAPGQGLHEGGRGSEGNAPVLIAEGSSYLAALSSDARLLVFPLEEVPRAAERGRAYSSSRCRKRRRSLRWRRATEARS